MALNPVERKMLDLSRHWQEFRAASARRLLVWQVHGNAARMLQCFFEVQKHETDYSTGDLFVVFDAPFENSIQYSRDLKEALSGQYEASREDLDQQGIEPGWQYKSQQFPDSASGFIQTLKSFGSQHHESIGHLVAVLMPTSVSDDAAFASWLRRALAAGIPERLRLCVTDSTQNPRLSQLVECGHELIYVDSPKIDTLTVAQETFAQEAAVGPAGIFRNHLMGLMTLVEKGSAAQVKVKAIDALNFARKQQWPDQEVVVTMLMAGALLKEKSCEDAASVYRQARKAAKKASSEGHPAGQEMVLQTWFGEAGAYLADGNDVKAAHCYDEAAVLAQQIPNPILAIEASRMAGCCFARLQDRASAIERGSIALRLGEGLKPEARLMTTLPIAAMDLLRVIEPERARSIENIKYWQETQIRKSQENAEHRAEQSEQRNDPAVFSGIEQNLTNELEVIEKKAGRLLQALIASSGQQFRESFSRGRRLLSDQWPLATAGVISVPAETEEGVAA